MRRRRAWPAWTMHWRRPEGDKMITEHQVVACKRLLSKVVTQAVEDYQDVLKKEGIQAAQGSRVGLWLMETRPDGHGNFPHICELMNLAHERLQTRLNTRDLMRQMRAHQAMLEARYKALRAQVNGDLGGVNETDEVAA